MARADNGRTPPGRAVAPIPDGDLWRVDFRKGGRNGTRYRRTFGSWEDAQSFIANILSGNAPAAAATLPGLVDEYIRWAEKIKGKAPATVRCDRARLKVFEAWADHDQIRCPVDVDFKAMANFQRYFFENAPFDKSRIHKRYKQLNTAATWEKYRQILSAFFVWCIKRGHAKDNPAADPEFKVKTMRDIPNPFKPDELAAILEYFADRESDQSVPVMSIFIRFIVYTGLRRGEMIALRWADIDERDGVIRVIRSKNQEPGTIPINPKLRPWIDRLPKVGPLVFDDGSGRPLYCSDWYLKELVRACRETGIPRRRIHDLRHTFAVTLVLAGVSLAVVQRLLGHKSIQTTMIYLTFMPADLKDAVGKLDF